MSQDPIKHAFVLCAGRCGSVTFARACEHITNFSAGHETRCSKLGDERLDYPNNHIEVDNRLAWFLGRMQSRFGDNAVYVHLTRDATLTAESYNRRWTFHGAISMAYARGILKSRLLGLDPCHDMVRTITENIRYYLKDKTHVFEIDIADPEEGFTAFWYAIGAQGDLNRALKEFHKRYNAQTPENGQASSVTFGTDDEKALFEMNRILKLFEEERLELLPAASRAIAAVARLEKMLKPLGFASLSQPKPSLEERILHIKEFSAAHQQKSQRAHLSLQEEATKAQEEAAKAQEEAAKAQEEAAKAQEEAAKAQEDIAQARDKEQLARTRSKLLYQENSTLKNSLRFRMGNSIVVNSRSPLRWPLIPVSLVKLGVQHVRKAKMPVSVPTSAPVKTPVKGSQPKAATIARPKIHPHALQESSVLADTHGIEAAQAHVNLHGTEDAKVSFELIKANQHLDDDTRWLSHVNAYLSRHKITPIELTSGDKDRFQRITAHAGPKITGGPKISVIMPAYNAEAFIHHSTRSILEQTWENLELIIVDDVSGDNTWACLQEIAKTDSRVKIVRNAVNTGPYVAKNIGMKMTTGAYVTGQDADDWAHPQRLASQVALLQNEANIKASMAYMLRMDATGRFTHFMKVGKTSADGVLRLASISTMFDRAFMARSLGYWDCVRFGADSELIERARTLLGDEGFVTQETVSMLCLDVETSLTNHVQTGVSKTTGVSPVRRMYRDSWTTWHDTLSPEQSFMDFPQTPRFFAAPKEMEVPLEDVRKAITGIPEKL